MKYTLFVCSGNTCDFQENHKNALEANISGFQEISVKYLPFPHPGISFITKDLSHIKVYTYFNIQDAKID